MRMSLGLAQSTGGAVLAVPVSLVEQNPMHGLVLRVHNEDQETQLLSAHRVLFLVQGTCQSTLERVNAEGDADAYCVTSSKTKCLLAEGALAPEAEIDLKGYCDMMTMLDFRLNKETAIVMVSSLETEDGKRAAAVELVRKIEPHQVSQYKALFDIEWKTTLTQAGADTLDSHTSPARPEYWEAEGQPPARKARRVDSDAKSPTRGGG